MFPQQQRKKKQKKNEEPHAAILVKPVTLNTEQQNHNFKPIESFRSEYTANL